jgi:hypothetical protein
MKRLLEWKQRMLQSPLTRKSSRNASRTQTPTNSDSPVPSLNNDDIRKRVIEELAAQGGQVRMCFLNNISFMFKNLSKAVKHLLII